MTTELTRWERLVLLRILPAMVSVAAVVVVGLAVLVQRNDDNVDGVRTSVQRLEDFVDDLENETPGEAERNAAITRAVQLVPEIKDILCGEFPEAVACR